MSLEHKLARTLLVARIIEDVLYGDYEWTLQVGDEAHPAGIDMDSQGVEFFAVIDSDLGDAMAWVIKDGDPVITVPLYSLRGEDQVRVRVSVGAGDQVAT